MGSPRRRAQFLAGRALLRHALDRTLGAPARHWELVAAPGGKPVLAHPGPSWDFSISHSGALVLCAVATRGCVGVDIERVSRRRTPWATFARQVLHPMEMRELDGLDDQLRWRGLYRAWTLKEALAKAMGLGLALCFRDVAIAKNEPSLLALPHASGMRAADWQLSLFSPSPDHMAALAWNPNLHLADVRLGTTGAQPIGTHPGRPRKPSAQRAAYPL
jgi:4'-phosphopantetheinyl transferase